MIESVLAGLLDLLCKPLCLAVSVLCVSVCAHVLVCVCLLISSPGDCVFLRATGYCDRHFKEGFIKFISISLFYVCLFLQ